MPCSLCSQCYCFNCSPFTTINTRLTRISSTSSEQTKLSFSFATQKKNTHRPITKTDVVFARDTSTNDSPMKNYECVITFIGVGERIGCDLVYRVILLQCESLEWCSIHCIGRRCDSQCFRIFVIGRLFSSSFHTTRLSDTATNIRSGNCLSLAIARCCFDGLAVLIVDDVLFCSQPVKWFNHRWVWTVQGWSRPLCHFQIDLARGMLAFSQRMIPFWEHYILQATIVDWVESKRRSSIQDLICFPFAGRNSVKYIAIA